MKKVIVIPDVHNKIGLVDAIIQQEPDAGKFIFLGDLFDDYGDSLKEIKRVASWIKERVHDSRFVFLWGNHDIPYGFRNRTIPCRGYSIEKDLAIWRVLDEEDFYPWRFFWVAQGFLLTHAGLHPNFLPPVWKQVSLGSLKEYLLAESEKCLRALNDIYSQHWFFLAGDARCHPPRGIDAGGILWCDANQEFQPIPGISQIFGHTHQKNYPKVFNGDSDLMFLHSDECLKIKIKASNMWNIALDCRLKFYGVLEGGELIIKSSPNFC